MRVRRSSLTETLAGARAASFVLRRELDLLLDAGGALRRPLTYLQGPGGVGKSELLREIARRQQHLGARVVWLDARLVEPRPEAVAAALPVTRGERTLLVVDHFENLTPIALWFWERHVPSLPDGVQLCCAGRWRLPPRWRADAGLAFNLATVDVGNFDRAESGRFLDERGLPAAHHDAYFARTYGHPLALALACELCPDPSTFARDGLNGSVGLVQGLLDELWRGSAASPAQVRALMTCALARRTPEALVREVCGELEARALFDWLRGLSFIEADARGLFPHDLVRDALVADLGWRDAALRNELCAAARRHVAGELVRDPGAAGVVSDVIHLLGHIEVWQSRIQRGGLDLGDLGAPAAAEWPGIEEMVRRHQGETAVSWLGFWRGRGARVVALRDDQGALAGMVCVLLLEGIPTGDAARDPGVAPLVDWLARHRPPPGCPILYLRFWMSREHHQLASPEMTRILAHAMKVGFETPRIAFLFCANHDPERWRPMHQEPGSCCAGVFTVDGREYGIFGHDVRGRAPIDWFEEQFRTIAPPSAAHTAAPLSPDEILEATRRALRAIDRPDLLRDSRLVDAPLVRHPAGDDTAARQARAEALCQLIRGECEQFLRSPRDQDLYRVLHRTYFAPSVKQRAAADELGLSFITYRRYLASAIRRLADRLWQRQSS